MTAPDEAPPVYKRRWAEDVPADPPHPEPIVASYQGDHLAAAKVWGWTNLMGKVAPGWEISQWRAIGWTMTATGKTGHLVESIAVRMRHDPTGARAVGLIHRPLDEETHQPTDAGWGSVPGMAWVECSDPACPNAAAAGHPAAGSVSKAGARMLMAALKGTPPLETDPDGTRHWPRAAADEEES